MGLRRLGRRVITFLALLLALVPAGARAAAVLARSVFHSADLRSNAVTSFTVTCPRGYAALSAGIVRPATGTALIGVRPLTDRSYSFRLANPAANPRQRVTVAAACRKLSASGSTALVLKLKQLKTKPLVVAPGTVGSTSLTCPPGMVPAGAGEDLDPVRRRSGSVPAAAVSLSLRRETSSLRSFSFAVRNSGRSPRSVILYGNCVTVLRAAGARPQRLHVRVSTFGEVVHSGPQTLRHRCPSGWFSLAAGFALRSPLTSLIAAAAVADGGRWSVTSDATGPTRADVQLSCGRIGPD